MSSDVFIEAWCGRSQYTIRVDVFDKIKIEEYASLGMIDISATCMDPPCKGRAFPTVKGDEWCFTPDPKDPNADKLGSVEEKLCSS